MILSERGAIRSAIADGGFHLYPAGKLLDLISSETQGDMLNGDFDPQRTLEKIAGLKGPENPKAQEIFRKDIKLLCDRLTKMEAAYDIEAVFDRMMSVMPAMAKRYYGIDNFEAPRPTIVEYFFEGYNELYKDGDWIAFNVNKSESIEMKVPVGTYFKRSQISPGHPEFITLHEANHAMQESLGLTDGIHQYIPWMDEGLADIMGRLMLFRVTGDETLLAKCKNSRTEVEVTDPRKVTYHYGEAISAMLLLKGRLPFVKALMQARKREAFSIDWNTLALKVRAGWDPHIAVVTAYMGSNKDAFRKRLERDEAAFRKEADFDQSDLHILGMFLATQPPACLPAGEYTAALMLAEEIAKKPSPHFVDPLAIPTSLREQIPNWNQDTPISATEIPASVWKKVPELEIKVLINKDTLPAEYKDTVAALAAKYFILERHFGDKTFYEPYGGGLPYRLGAGEVRCVY